MKQSSHSLLFLFYCKQFSVTYSSLFPITYSQVITFWLKKIEKSVYTRRKRRIRLLSPASRLLDQQINGTSTGFKCEPIFRGHEECCDLSLEEQSSSTSSKIGYCCVFPPIDTTCDSSTSSSIERNTQHINPR